ncbi:MAG: radical SAM family heme chaperone HemW [Hyphomicrobiales bacterium]
MAGIYLHIPFCKQKCNYCNFYSVASSRYKEDVLKAISKELISRKRYLGNQIVSTIYFGGGTPSTLSSYEVNTLIEVIADNYHLDSDLEITFEANPDDLSAEKVTELKQTPINRFSIGIQSFHDEDLKYLNRVHSGQEAKDVIKRVQDSGYNNLTIDLIYGIPTLTNNKWKANLSYFFDLEISHLSAYSLTVEPHTALDLFIRKGKLANVDEEQSIEQFNILLREIKMNHFLQYEISNFCRDGFFSKHNRNYWNGSYYIGVGPSAHSYNGKSRQWNVSAIKPYIEGVNKDESYYEIEFLKCSQRFNEYIMTSIRTIWGVSLDYIERNFGTSYRDHFLKGSVTYTDRRWMTNNNGNYVLTEEGRLHADGIAAEFFFIV